jgi:hypothetical protein
MSFKVVQFRRGTTVETEVFTGAPGEITVDTDKWVAVIQDGHTAGGHPVRLDETKLPRVRYLLFRAAAVQQGVASLGFSSPLNNGPMPVALIDNASGLITGAAAFHAYQNNSIQDHFLLPTDWVVPLNVDIVWRTNTTIGSVVWWFESCCVPIGTLLEENYFGVPQVVTTITSGHSNMLTTSTIQINTMNFAPDGELFFRLTRDGGDDTVDVDVELLSLRFSILVQEK